MHKYIERKRIKGYLSADKTAVIFWGFSELDLCNILAIMDPS